MSPITDHLWPLDEQAFGARVEAHRREVRAHCSRPDLLATLSAGVGRR